MWPGMLFRTFAVCCCLGRKSCDEQSPVCACVCLFVCLFVCVCVCVCVYKAATSRWGLECCFRTALGHKAAKRNRQCVSTCIHACLHQPAQVGIGGEGRPGVSESTAPADPASAFALLVWSLRAGGHRRGGEARRLRRAGPPRRRAGALRRRLLRARGPAQGAAAATAL